MLTQSTNYAIRALAFMQGPDGEFMLIRDIANHTKIPASYLAKIVGQLHKRDLVLTRRGSHGGVKSAREPRMISVLDVCMAMRDPVLHSSCLLDADACQRLGACTWEAYEIKLDRTLREYLGHVTVVDVAAAQESADARRDREFVDNARSDARFQRNRMSPKTEMHPA